MSVKTNFYIMVGAYIVLSNHVFFNYLFEGTFLSYWKQVLSIYLLFVSGFIIQRQVKLSSCGINLVFIYVILLTLVAITATFSILMGYSFLRVSYAIISYVGFLSFIFLPVIAWKTKRLEVLFRVIYWLGLFVCAGIIVDYYFSVVSFRTIENQEIFRYNQSFGATKRTAFLLGGENTASSFLSGTVLFSFLGKVMFPRLFGLKHLLTLVILALIAALFTGTRTAFYGVLMTVFLSSFTLLWLSGKTRFRGVLIIVICIILAPYLFNISLFPEDDRRRFTEININKYESQRLRQWSAGLNNFRGGIDQYLIGRGLGSSMGNIQDGMPRYPHYESTILMSFSEIGLVGVVLRYGPALTGLALVAFLFFNASNKAMKASSGLLLGWGLFYIAITFVAPTAGAYHTQILYFLWFGFCSLNYCHLLRNRDLMRTLYNSPTTRTKLGR